MRPGCVECRVQGVGVGCRMWGEVCVGCGVQGVGCGVQSVE